MKSSWRSSTAPPPDHVGLPAGPFGVTTPAVIPRYGGEASVQRTQERGQPSSTCSIQDLKIVSARHLHASIIGVFRK